MVLGGLWFSDKKPVMSTFLKPFRTSLEELETKGTGTYVILISTLIYFMQNP